ncbi:MAG: hypothetical protein QM699_07570 [Amaricoccus sp.]|uniref:DUF6948 domain-containing protein n=1 Tax=Amaricoccus sp. TaxID=1872485 RepID=UPI0039E5881E
MSDYVIIRTYSAGVHAGELMRRDGREVELRNARRLWRWHTADRGISLSEVATAGINASKSRVCETLPSIILTEAIEIIPATDVARATIESADVYRV